LVKFPYLYKPTIFFRDLSSHRQNFNNLDHFDLNAALIL